MAQLMLLDSASLYFRAYYGVKADVRAPDGTRVNALRGFLDMLSTLITAHQPHRMVACWDDDWRPQWRVDAIPSYKTHRVADPAAGTEESPDDLSVQVPLMAQALALLGIARLGGHHCEADDVIGTLTARELAAPKPDAVQIVTGDRDLFQLVDDEHSVQVLYTGTGVRNAQVVTEAWLQDRYAIANGAAYADVAVLRGDPSDGLPGVRGIGEKTAVGLIGTFGTLDAVQLAARVEDPRIKPAVAANLTAAQDYLAAARLVVRVLPDADLPLISDALPTTVNRPAVNDFGTRWGVLSPMTNLADSLEGNAAQTSGSRSS